MPIDDPIALEAKDVFPETWEALAQAKSFGESGLLRSLERVMVSVFTEKLTSEEQDVLDPVVLEYAGKMLALRLCQPALDYWSKQLLSQATGENQSESYKDRAAEIKELRQQLLAETAELFLEISDLLPVRRRRAKDSPRVAQAGDNIPHATANPLDMEPLYGNPVGSTGSGLT